MPPPPSVATVLYLQERGHLHVCLKHTDTHIRTNTVYLLACRTGLEYWCLEEMPKGDRKDGTESFYPSDQNSSVVKAEEEWATCI